MDDGEGEPHDDEACRRPVDVVVKDDDAVATVGKMKALLQGWTIGRVMLWRQRMSKALLLSGG